MTKLCAQTLCAKGKMNTLQSTIILSNVGIIYPLSRHIIHQDIFSRIVGMIYPIPTKASNCVKCPKLFDFISIRTSKCLFSSPRPKGAQKLSNLHSSPKSWHDISNTIIYNPPKYIPPNCCMIYPLHNSLVCIEFWHKFLDYDLAINFLKFVFVRPLCYILSFSIFLFFIFFLQMCHSLFSLRF